MVASFETERRKHSMLNQFDSKLPRSGLDDPDVLVAIGRYDPVNAARRLRALGWSARDAHASVRQILNDRHLARRGPSGDRMLSVLTQNSGARLTPS